MYEVRGAGGSFYPADEDALQQGIRAGKINQNTVLRETKTSREFRAYEIAELAALLEPVARKKRLIERFEPPRQRAAVNQPLRRVAQEAKEAKSWWIRTS